jgi:hypothetical protein
MKTKRQIAVVVAALTLVLVGSASANLILFDTYKDTPEDTDHIVSVASTKLGETLNNLLRLDNLATLAPGGPISITYFALDSGSGSNPNNAANITWNFTGTGAQLLAVYVFGGSNGANLYKVNDVGQMTSGSATVHTPLTGNSGAFATISHILFLGTGTIPGGGTVPDGGTTLALFAAGLGVIGFARLKVS